MSRSRLPAARLLATLVATLLASPSAAPAQVNPFAAAAADDSLAPPPVVAREFRAAWLSPVYGSGMSDWPSAPGLPAEQQKAELRALLDCARDAGLNTVVLHVRMAGDALYPTPLAPWSAFLSGKSGVAPEPFYDPLAFAVAEAHARGLQLHAWFNPFRAMLPNFVGAAARSHVTREHPEWVRRYGGETWIDPGEPAARRAVLATIVDVVKRYDVDGVHIDDYFYPYRETETIRRRVGKGKRRHTVTTRREIPFPDAATWRRYGAGHGWSDRDAWRRSNVDGLVKEMYAQVKKEKPWVMVGVSPFGIWRPGSPPGITGLDAYSEIYADSRRWLREGWMDYLAPQLYWALNGEQSRFRVLDRWWHSENVQGRHIWPGINTTRVGAPRASWPASEIYAQVSAIRQGRADAAASNIPAGAGDDGDAVGALDSPGHVHFRLGAICGGDRRAPLATAMHEALYRDPAIVPAAPWLDARVPAAPSVTALGVTGMLSVVPADDTPVSWWLVQWREADGSWKSRLRRVEEHGAAPVALDAGANPTAVAVSAVGRAGVSGKATVVVMPKRLTRR